MKTSIDYTFSETKRTRRVLTLTFGLAMMCAFLLVGLQAANPAYAVPINFIVNTTADTSAANDGACEQPISIFDDEDCTLREAINAANSNSNPAERDRITFSMLGNGPHVISVGEGTPSLKGLPKITQPVIINGYTQGDTSSTTADDAIPNTAVTGTNAVLKIVLDGSKAGSTPSKPVDGLYVTAPNTTVRGLVINNGFRSGVLFDQETPSDAGRRLAGCFIGTDASGTNPRSNGAGVIIDDGEGNVIGGTTLAARNLISGNNNDGIFLSSAANGNSIQGNLIGTNKDAGKGDNLGNFKGVYILGGSSNTVGGNGAASNTIAYNDGRHAIQVQRVSASSPAIGNRILSNSIHSNDGLGIQLGAEADPGVTPNDGDNPATPQPDPDSDAGANRLQNFPVITSATRLLDRTTTISGRLNSHPRTAFTIQLFSNPAKDPSGFGEGKTLLTQIQLTTNRNGRASFDFVTGRGVVSEGEYITATATRDSTGDTSEFSRARLVEGLVNEQ